MLEQKNFPISQGSGTSSLPLNLSGQFNEGEKKIKKKDLTDRLDKLRVAISEFSGITAPICLDGERFKNKEGKQYKMMVLLNCIEVGEKFLQNQIKEHAERLEKEMEKSDCQKWANDVPKSVVEYIEELLAIKKQEEKNAEVAAFKLKEAKEKIERLRDPNVAALVSMKNKCENQKILFARTNDLQLKLKELVVNAIALEKEISQLKKGENLEGFNGKWIQFVKKVDNETHCFNETKKEVDLALKDAEYENNIPEELAFYDNMRNLWDETGFVWARLTSKRHLILIDKEIPKLEKLSEEISVAREAILKKKREFEEIVRTDGARFNRSKTGYYIELPENHKDIHKMVEVEATNLEYFKEFDKRLTEFPNIYAKIKLKGKDHEVYSFKPLKKLFNPPLLRGEHIRYFTKTESNEALNKLISLDLEERRSRYKKITHIIKEISAIKLLDFSIQINQIGDCSRDGCFTEKTFYDETAKITKVVAVCSSIAGSVKSMMYDTKIEESKLYAVPSVKFNDLDPYLNFKEKV